MRVRHGWLLGFLSVAALSAADTSGRLIDAVKAGNQGRIRSLLKTPGKVNVAEADGTTALHWAVRADDAETVRLLIRSGAKVNAANRQGITPLSLAATNGNA